MDSKEFRAALVKIMPGYKWTVHIPVRQGRLEATGIQTSGSNRLSTLSVVRIDQEDLLPLYEVKSAGYGRRAEWLHINQDNTLPRALRGLQNYYEAQARTYSINAANLEHGRKAKVAANGAEPESWQE